MSEGRSKFSTLFLGLLLIALLGGLTLGALNGPPPPTVSASLTADPASFTGFCPTTVTFKGGIVVSGACTVQCRFVRSDGVIKPAQTVVFMGPAKKAVADTWALSTSYSGWEVLEVISPVKVKSAPANFSITCLPKPVITALQAQHLGYPVPEIWMNGKNFGAAKGSKDVRVDGNVVTNYFGGWHDTSLTFTLPGSYIPWEHVYQFCIVDGSTVISNIYSKRFLYHFEVLVPTEGYRGTEVKLPVFKLPASPGGLEVKIGTYAMTVTSWTGGAYGEIKARVPLNMPFGEHDVYLQKGSDVVSNKIKFKVKAFPKPPLEPVKKTF